MRFRIPTVTLCVVVLSQCATPDQSRTNAVSESWEERLRMQVSHCWRVDVGIQGVEEMEAEIKVVVNPDATVASVEYGILTQSRMADAGYRKFAESARRAVLKCSPLDVPRSLPYEVWKHITFTFNPKEMLGP